MVHIRGKTPERWTKNQNFGKKMKNFFWPFLVFCSQRWCLTADMHHYGTVCSLGGPLPNPKKIFKIRPSSKKLDLKFEKKSCFLAWTGPWWGARWSILVSNDRSSRDLSSTNISSAYLEGPRFFGQKTQKFTPSLTCQDSLPRLEKISKIVL